MSYNTLAPVTLTATATDPSGLNTGNWTNAFTSAVLPRVNPVYEVHHMTVTGGQPLIAGRITAAGQNWSTVQLDINGQNEWDPSQPLLLTSGQELYVYWAAVATANPPIVTVWARYDPALSSKA